MMMINVSVIVHHAQAGLDICIRERDCQKVIVSYNLYASRANAAQALVNWRSACQLAPGQPAVDDSDLDLCMTVV